MKCLVVLTIALVAFVAAHEEQPPKGLADDLTESQIHDQCVELTGVTAEQLAAFRRMERSDESQVHEYVLCTLKKGGYFTEENGHNVERLITELRKAHLDEETARWIVTKCADSNEQKSPPAVWAYRCAECLWANKIEDLIRQAREKIRNKNENKV